MKIEHDRNARGQYVAWNELEYLSQKILYWLYRKHQRTRALRFARRLDELLRADCKSSCAIASLGGWALYYALVGDAKTAARYRRREINNVEWFFRTPNQTMSNYDRVWLADRLVLLACDLDDAGLADDAMAALEKARGLYCTSKVPFLAIDFYQRLKSNHGKTRRATATGVALETTKMKFRAHYANVRNAIWDSATAALTKVDGPVLFPMLLDIVGAKLYKRRASLDGKRWLRRVTLAYSEIPHCGTSWAAQISPNPARRRRTRETVVVAQQTGDRR